MGKSKKSASKKTDNSKVEARPIGEGKDPLAEGNTLENPSNTEAETHYNVKERGADVQAAENTIAGQDANERAEQHNAQAVNAPSDVPNSDAAEQDEVAAGREEPGDETPAEEAAETPAEEPAEPAAPEAPVDESPAEEGTETPAEEASEPTTAPAVPSEADLNV